MAHKHDKEFDRMIAEIKKIAADPQETVRREQKKNAMFLKDLTAYRIGVALATFAFACDESHTLRDWEWHIAQGHVTEENQYWRQC